jgi:hypothetical protein
VVLDVGASPAIDKPFRDFFGDLEKEHPGLAMTLSRGRNAFVPIPFGVAMPASSENGNYRRRKRALVEDQVRVLPWREFLELLWAGEVC